MNRTVLIFPASILLSTLAPATVIDTISTWNGTSSVFSFGYPDTATYGQTITAPAANVLNSFTFMMDVPAATTFAAYVYAWDGSKATGSQLFGSGPLNTTGAAGFETMTFNTGGLALTTGQQYVLFASVSGQVGSGQGQFGATGDDYAGGLFVFINNGQNQSLWTTTNWNQNHTGLGHDLAFRANFGDGAPVIPAPAAGLAMMLGLLGGRLRRRSRA
jgi:hypothetical protein